MHQHDVARRFNDDGLRLQALLHHERHHSLRTAVGWAAVVVIALCADSPAALVAVLPGLAQAFTR